MVSLCSQQVIVDFLEEIEMLSDAHSILEATDDQMRMTPLHVAALNSDPTAVRWDLALLHFQYFSLPSLTLFRILIYRVFLQAKAGQRL